ncbi:hypothetical protein EW145_g1258 [Phellinidium pouzarii]|uniref:Uncharacterized protein n=1 Tax=Phellinidium pouzarii TaxID=167371 RepID=A0A4V3XDP8_9AGAM|nr:hypothetical protein EW145_g1258 [Phellinidium pouzarii]
MTSLTEALVENTVVELSSDSQLSEEYNNVKRLQCLNVGIGTLDLEDGQVHGSLTQLPQFPSSSCSSSSDILPQKLLQAGDMLNPVPNLLTATVETCITSSQQKIAPKLFFKGIYSLPDEILYLIFIYARGGYELETRLDSKDDMNSIASFLSIVAPHAYRWQTFDIDVSWDYWERLNSLIKTQFREMRLSSLTNLIMKGGDGHENPYDSRIVVNYEIEDGQPDFFCDWDMPKLHSMSAVRRVPASPFSTLTSLTFLSTTYENLRYRDYVYWDFKGLIKYLKSHLALQTLRLSLQTTRNWGGQTFECLTLRSLTHLDLEIFSSYILRGLMKMMDLPMLESLRLDLHLEFQALNIYDAHDDIVDNEDNKSRDCEMIGRWFRFISYESEDYHWYEFNHLKDIDIKIQACAPLSSFFVYDILCRCHRLQTLSLDCPIIKLLSRKDRPDRARPWTQKPIPLRTLSLLDCNLLDGQFLDMFKAALDAGDSGDSALSSGKSENVENFSALEIIGDTSFDIEAFLNFLLREKIKQFERVQSH